MMDHTTPHDKRLTYRILSVETRFSIRFVGVARDDNGKVLLGTPDHATYTDARVELDRMVEKFAPGFKLHYFDGEFPVTGGN